MYNALCSDAVPLAIVADAITELAPKLLLILDCYSPATSATRSFFVSAVSNYNQERKEFIFRLSDLLNLDETHADSLLQNFDRDEWEFEQFNSKVSLTEGRSSGKVFEYDDDAFFRAVDYYFNERRQLINVILTLFKLSVDEKEKLHEAARVFVDQARADDSEFGNRLLRQFGQLISQRIPQSVATDSIARKNLWIRQYLLEQKALVQTLFVMHYRGCHATRAFQILKKLKDYKFGRNQVHRYEFNAESRDLEDQVHHLCMLVGVEMLNLEGILEQWSFLENGADRKDFCQLPSLVLDFQNDIIQSYMENPEPISLLQMAWAAYLGCIKNKLEQEEYRVPTSYDAVVDLCQTKNMGAILAVRATNRGNIFEQLLKDLHGDLYSLNEPEAVGYKAVLRGFMIALDTGLGVSRFYQDSYTILICVEKIYENNPMMSGAFWEEDINIESRRGLLSFARNIFPWKFRPLIRTLTSMVSSAFTAKSIAKYFNEMPALCLLISADDTRVQQVLHNNTLLCRALEDLNCEEYSRQFPLVVSQGTDGVGVADNKERGINVVQFDRKFNGWQYMLCILDAFVMGRDESALFLADERRNTIDALDLDYAAEKDIEGAVGITRKAADLLNLFQKVMSFSPETCEYIMAGIRGDQHPDSEVFNLIFNVLTKAISLSQPPIDLVTNCLHAITALLKTNPQDIWFLLGDTDWISGEASSMIQMLNKEQRTGRYSVSKAYLLLVKQMVLESQRDNQSRSVKEDILLGVFTFVHRKIFIQFDGWIYMDLVEKFEIGKMVLDIYIAVLRDMTSQGQLMQFLWKTFIDEAETYQVVPLMNIIGGGKEKFNDLSNRRGERARVMYEEMLLSAFDCSMNFLFRWRATGKKTVSPFEKVLLTYPYGTNHLELSHYIAYYVTYTQNGRVAKAATELLTILCSVAGQIQVSGKTGRSGMGFIGYFGHTAYDLAAHISRTLKMNEADEDLQIAMWNFVAEIMDHQGPFATVLLHSGGAHFGLGKKTEKELKENLQDEPPESLISAIMFVLRNIKAFHQYRPAVLAGALKLLARLWRHGDQHRSAIRLLRSTSGFWDGLSDIFDLELSLKEQRSVEPLIAYLNQGCFYVDLELNSEYVRLCHEYCILSHVFSLFATDIMRECSPSNTDHPLLSKIKAIARDKDQTFWKIIVNPKWLDERLLTNLLNVLEEDNGVSLADFVSVQYLTNSGVAARFGYQYRYDVDLLEMKCNFASTLDAMEDDEALSFTPPSMACRLNLMFSIKHAQQLAISGWCDFLKTLASILGQKIWQDTGRTSQDKMLYVEAERLARKLSQEKTMDLTDICGHSEFAELVLCLIDAWIKACQSTPNKKCEIGRITELLSILIKSIPFVATEVVDSKGKLINGGVYVAIYSSILRLLQVLDPQDIASVPVDYAREIKDDLKALLVSISQVLRICFIAVLAQSYEGSIQVLETLMAVLTQTVRKLRGQTEEGFWLYPIKDNNIVKLSIQVLLTVFSNMVEKNASDKQIVVAASSDDGILVETILYTLLTLTLSPLASEHVAVNDVAMHFTKNPLTPYYKLADAIQPYTSTKERNGAQLAWCSMLNVVCALLRQMGDSRDFLQQIVNFLRMYSQRIGFVIESVSSSLFIGASGSSSGSYANVQKGDHVTLGDLEELQRTIEVVYLVARSWDICDEKENSQKEKPDILIDFGNLGANLLHSITHILQFPNKMADVVLPMADNEKDMASKSGLDETMDAGAENASVFLVKCREKLVVILRDLTATLQILLEADKIYQPDYTEIFDSMKVFLPTSDFNIHHASFGSLLYCISIISQLYRQRQTDVAGLGQDAQSVDSFLIPVKSLKDDQLLLIIQNCVLILSSQVACWYRAPFDENVMHFIQHYPEAIDAQLSHTYTHSRANVRVLVESEYSQYRDMLVRDFSLDNVRNKDISQCSGFERGRKLLEMILDKSDEVFVGLFAE